MVPEMTSKDEDDAFVQLVVGGGDDKAVVFSWSSCWGMDALSSNFSFSLPLSDTRDTKLEYVEDPARRNGGGWRVSSKEIAKALSAADVVEVLEASRCRRRRLERKVAFIMAKTVVLEESLTLW